PDAVADREQEHEEHRRLQRRRDRDPQLTDDDGGKEGRGDRAQADALEGERAEVVPEAKRQEDRDLRIATQRLREPLKHVGLRSSGPKEPAAANPYRLDSASIGPSAWSRAWPARRASGARALSRRCSRGSPSRRASA